MTRQQREALHWITSQPRLHLIEMTRINGRKMFRLYTSKKIILCPDFHKTVIHNLIKKDYLTLNDKKQIVLK